MVRILYGLHMSPPVRAARLTAHALNVEMDSIETSLKDKEHLTPEYLKMNPQHTIPTLDDNGYYLWDSHAISAYLVNQYGANDDLYPKEPRQRGIVDQRLHFDGTVLFPPLIFLLMSIIYQGATTIPKEQKYKVLEGYGYLEIFLKDRKYLAGDSLTIADLCVLSSVSTLHMMIPVTSDKFPKLLAWLQRNTKLPYYQIANGNGLDKLTALYKTKMGLK